MKELAFVAQALGLSPTQIRLFINRYVVDSRLVSPGDLFFALEGNHSDGHRFLKEVASRGGIAAVVHSSYKGESYGLILLKVDHVLQALQTLAQTIQKERKQKIIGVTGSVGKTTTKEFIATLLVQRYSVDKTLGNYNSQVGLPLMILNSLGKSEIFVAEMGISQPGNLEKLVQIIPPEISVVTNIGHAHIGCFPQGMEEIAWEKRKIFSLPQIKGGVLHHQAIRFKAFQTFSSCPFKTFGLIKYPSTSPLPDYRWGETGNNLIEEAKEIAPFPLPFCQTHFCENFLAAVAVARMVGLSWKEIQMGSQQLSLPPLRFEQIQQNGVTFINDCYSANPESMIAALSNLPFPAPSSKRIAVLGEMAELGNYSHQAHSDIGAFATQHVDHLLSYGEGARALWKSFHKSGKPCEWWDDLKQLKKRVFEIANPGDVVLVKGSNINQMWNILK